VKKLVAVGIIMMTPCSSYGGFFSNYDESKLTNFKNSINQFYVAPLGEKEPFLAKASVMNGEIQRDCSNISRTATYYLNQCYGAYDFTSSALVESYIYYAKSLISAGEKDNAKTTLRQIVVGFTGEKFKSYINEARFMLEDLDKEPASQADDVELIKLQLELEKTKLELEKLKSQNR